MPGPVTKPFAPTGGARVPSRPPRLPAAPAKIELAVVETAESGESIILPDVRDPQTGRLVDAPDACTDVRHVTVAR